MPRYAYVDASAMVKLIAREPETDALERDCVGRDGLLASRLTAAEVTRAVGRSPSKRILQQVRDVIESFVLIDITTTVLDEAGSLSPADLRTLDAIHLATALSLDLPDLDFIA
jgi:hypothetical protein